MSGFSWNSSDNRWEAEEEVWDQLIEVRCNTYIAINLLNPFFQSVTINILLLLTKIGFGTTKTAILLAHIYLFSCDYIL